MDIEKSIGTLKVFRNYNKFYKEENKDLTITITLEAKESIDKAIERLLTAYEKEKRLAEANLKDSEEFQDNMCNHRCILNSEIEELKQELEKEKEKNNKIDEFCRKELAFERRLKRENRELDEFNQGRFYVSENIRKIIKEE